MNLMKNRAPQTPIYTIGYGSRALDAFIETLRKYGAQYLADVRSAPYSRYKPEFSKEPLEQALRREGLHYVYMGAELGGMPKDRSCYVNGKVNYNLVREAEFYQKGIARLADASERGLPTAAMCSEAKPEMCHRSKLIGKSLTEAGVETLHIDENGSLLTQEQVMKRLTGGQGSLFGEGGFQSRKRYR